MTEPLTDAELEAEKERHGECPTEDCIQDYPHCQQHRLDQGWPCVVVRAIEELRALRTDLAAAELRESIWREGPDSTFELAQQNAKLVAALERLNEAATELANDHTSSVAIKEFIDATGQADATLASVKGEQG